MITHHDASTSGACIREATSKQAHTHHISMSSTSVRRWTLAPPKMHHLGLSGATHAIDLLIASNRSKRGTTCASQPAAICLRSHRVVVFGREGLKIHFRFLRYSAALWPQKNAINIIKFIRLLALSSWMFSRCPFCRPLRHRGLVDLAAERYVIWRALLRPPPPPPLGGVRLIVERNPSRSSQCCVVFWQRANIVVGRSLLQFLNSFDLIFSSDACLFFFSVLT